MRQVTYFLLAHLKPECSRPREPGIINGWLILEQHSDRGNGEIRLEQLADCGNYDQVLLVRYDSWLTAILVRSTVPVKDNMLIHVFSQDVLYRICDALCIAHADALRAGDTANLIDLDPPTAKADTDSSLDLPIVY